MNLRHWLLMCCLGWSIVCGVPKQIVHGQSGESPAVLSDSSATALGHAEALLEAARAGKLTDAGAAQAADLLDHEDPFVRGIAEWAIGTKVQRENSGPVAVWPGEDPPSWYRQWVQLDGGFLLDVDYVRQGAAWDIHRDHRKMQASLVKIIHRATGAAAEVAAGGAAEESRLSVNRRLAALQSIQARLDSLVEAGPLATTAMRKLWLEARHTARPIVLANPAIDFDSLVFVTRHSGTFANITGSQYPWSHKPGGLRSPRGVVRTPRRHYGRCGFQPASARALRPARHTIRARKPAAGIHRHGPSYAGLWPGRADRSAAGR